MPTALRVGAYRMFFYSLENNEPAHIHIERDDMVAKYWLNPVALAANNGFRSHELTKLGALVIEHQVLLQETWIAHFSG
jgi:hypothetical protein